MKENINEHDMTKKMMEIMRGGYKSRLITENEDGADLSPVSGDAIYNETLKELQDTVHSSAKITNFKIYPNDGNVVVEGTFEQGTDESTGIVFKCELKARDLETSMNNIELNDKISEILKKLKGYYSNFEEVWNIKMGAEYPPKTNQ